MSKCYFWIHLLSAGMTVPVSWSTSAAPTQTSWTTRRTTAACTYPPDVIAKRRSGSFSEIKHNFTNNLVFKSKSTGSPKTTASKWNPKSFRLFDYISCFFGFFLFVDTCIYKCVIHAIIKWNLPSTSRWYFSETADQLRWTPSAWRRKSPECACVWVTPIICLGDLEQRCVDVKIVQPFLRSADALNGCKIIWYTTFRLIKNLCVLEKFVFFIFTIRNSTFPSL